jgi:hypothetical protein
MRSGEHVWRLTLDANECDSFSIVRCLYNILALALVALWLPATLRCEIETLPGLEFLGCATPCNGADDKGCSDCANLETGLVKISNDQIKAPAPTELLPCQCEFCLRSEFLEPDPDGNVPRQQTGTSDERQRTWHFVRRAALPARAPSV